MCTHAYWFIKKKRAKKKKKQKEKNTTSDYKINVYNPVLNHSALKKQQCTMGSRLNISQIFKFLIGPRSMFGEETFCHTESSCQWYLLVRSFVLNCKSFKKWA